MAIFLAFEWVSRRPYLLIGPIRLTIIGHTANLWQKDKLLVYAGENEHRMYLSDVIIFDIPTATWTQPKIQGISPRGRARHAAVINDEKLWISGGMTGADSCVLDDLCYLDLKTWAWSKVWKFIPRYDHKMWFWSGKIYAFGGMGEEMEKTSELWWIDMRQNTALGHKLQETSERRGANYRSNNSRLDLAVVHQPNSSSVQPNPSSSIYRSPVPAPGPVSMLKFVSSPNLASQTVAQHFHVYTSGYLLDFVTPADFMIETGLYALDLETLTWHKLAEGKDLFNLHYQWHYCTMNQDGTQTWLLGYSPEPSAPRQDATEELLSDVLHIDLEKVGIIGNKLHQSLAPTSDSVAVSSCLSAIGADLARLFDKHPDSGSGTDFEVIGEADDDSNVDWSETSETPRNSQQILPPTSSKPIYVHKLILQVRWPHFARLWNSQMREFHTRKLVLPEPYSTVRSFLYYLYTDSIATPCDASNSSATTTIPSEDTSPSLGNVAGMLVMANMYDMPRLRALCVDRLGKELDVDHAAIIWERANTAGEDWLRRRAARFCMANWGRVVRTEAFRCLPQESLVELCEEATDEEGRVVGGAELELQANNKVGPLTAVSQRRRGNVMVAMEEEADEDGEGEMEVG
jgi:BTB/POZ domain/Galactose oxidase, central domain